MGFPEGTEGEGSAAAPAVPSPHHPGPGVGGSAGGPSGFQLASLASPREQQAGEWRFASLGSFSDCSRSPGFFGWRGEMGVAASGRRFPLLIPSLGRLGAQ